MNNVDEVYDKLKTTGQNSVDNIVQWLKDAQILELLHKSEEDARRLFDNLADKKNVTREQFKEMLKNLSATQDKTIEELSGYFLSASLKLINAFTNAAKAFENSLKEPDPYCMPGTSHPPCLTTKTHSNQLNATCKPCSDEKPQYHHRTDAQEYTCPCSPAKNIIHQSPSYPWQSQAIDQPSHVNQQQPPRSNQNVLSTSHRCLCPQQPQNGQWQSQSYDQTTPVNQRQSASSDQRKHLPDPPCQCQMHNAQPPNTSQRQSLKTDQPTPANQRQSLSSDQNKPLPRTNPNNTLSNDSDQQQVTSSVCSCLSKNKQQPKVDQSSTVNQKHPPSSDQTLSVPTTYQHRSPPLMQCTGECNSSNQQTSKNNLNLLQFPPKYENNTQTDIDQYLTDALRRFSWMIISSSRQALQSCVEPSPCQNQAKKCKTCGRQTPPYHNKTPQCYNKAPQCQNQSPRQSWPSLLPAPPRPLIVPCGDKINNDELPPCSRTSSLCSNPSPLCLKLKQSPPSQKQAPSQDPPRSCDEESAPCSVKWSSRSRRSAPCQKESCPYQKESSPYEKESSPYQNRTPPCQNHSSSSDEEEPPCSLKPSPRVQILPPCQKQSPSCQHETSPCHSQTPQYQNQSDPFHNQTPAQRNQPLCQNQNQIPPGPNQIPSCQSQTPQRGNLSCPYQNQISPGQKQPSSLNVSPSLQNSSSSRTCCRYRHGKP